MSGSYPKKLSFMTKRVEKVLAHEIMKEFRPTTMAEKDRHMVFDYIKQLIRRNLGFTVLPYGSTPLKTYLPNGDIDVTVFGEVTNEQIKEMVSLLESEMVKSKEKKEFGLLVIKDVKLVDAKVKVIKCIVGEIPVDISFNQIWGLSSLCFLEKAEQMIGRQHLLKESILLVKAWCYYESRTLGSHASLLSTYGLEILVLYIINFFHGSLTGPLSVLYTFLIYFSAFDWSHYCISILGVVRKSDMRVLPQSSHEHLLITPDILRSCWATFFVPKAAASANGFEARHEWSIIDPLSIEKNVGRSINKASSFRLRAAFRYGARKLGRIIRECEEVNLENELICFFENTLLHASRQMRGEEEVPEPLLGDWLELISSFSIACGRHGYMPPLLPDLMSECHLL